MMNRKRLVLFALIISALLFIAAGCSDDDSSDPTADANPTLGQSWSQLGAISGFTGRQGAGVAVLNDRLYIACGFTGSPLCIGDCWSTSDGTNWQQDTTDGVNANGLHDFAMAANNGKLWIHGGVDKFGSIQNKIRYSNDGDPWTSTTPLVSTNTRYYHTMVTFNGALWTIGGYQRVSGLSDTVTNSVACSTNGTTWYEMGTPGTCPRYLSGAAEHNGKLFVIGGSATSDSTTATNDIWCTEDGLTWSCIITNAPFGRRRAFGLVSTGNRMYLVGGMVASGVYTNDIWKSYDGKTWEQVAVSNAFPNELARPCVAAFNGGIYVIAGYINGSGYTNGIWFTK